MSLHLGLPHRDIKENIYIRADFLTFKMNFMYRTKQKVIPNLSVRSDELRKRMSNNSITLPDLKGNFSLDAGIAETLRMTRAELFRSHLEGVEKTRSLKKALEREQQAAKAKAAEFERNKLYAKAKAEAIEELKRSNNG